MRKAIRLKSGQDFEEVFSRGKMSSNDDFVLYQIPGKKKGIRIGICVGKSLGSAVKRNRLKRQISEVIRKLEFDCESVDAVLIARKNIKDGSFQRIYEAVCGVFSKALLLL